MPMLKSNKIKSKLSIWWQKNKASLFTTRKNNNSTTTTTTTQNWRHLSPDEPPLPFLVSNNNHVSTNSKSIKFSSERDNFSSELAPTLKNIIDYVPSTSIYLSPQQQRTSSSSRELYTIPELSEMNTTISTTNNSSTISTSVTPLNNNIPINNTSSALEEQVELSFQPPLAKEQEEPCIVPSSSITSISSFNSVQQQPNNNERKVYNSTPTIVIHDDSDSSSSSSQHVPISEWPSSLSKEEPVFKESLLGNELECKLIFCHMLESAYNYYHHKEKRDSNNEPKEMHILFNEQGNIGGIKLILQDENRQDYLEFGGTPQYIPPELSTSAIYNHELADVWALGISLYRMLIGKYPFTTTKEENHVELFKKMLNSDFSIPHHVSAEAKDLLRRMLAPENSRASFDLILFHPWIKSFIQQDHIFVSSSKATTTHNIKQKKKGNKRKKVLRVIKKGIRLVFLGPYPPPPRNYYYH